MWSFPPAMISSGACGFLKSILAERSDSRGIWRDSGTTYLSNATRLFFHRHVIDEGILEAFKGHDYGEFWFTNGVM
jgi:hypothetical protein